jgi:hypothetical protein
MSKIYRVENGQMTLVLEGEWRDVIQFIRAREKSLGVHHTKTFPENSNEERTIYYHIGEETYFTKNEEK